MNTYGKLYLLFLLIVFSNLNHIISTDGKTFHYININYYMNYLLLICEISGFIRSTPLEDNKALESSTKESILTS